MKKLKPCMVVRVFRFGTGSEYTVNQLKPPREPRGRFERYQKCWRTVLVDILEWPAEAFAEFVSRREEWLRESGSEIFFHDLPYKYVCSELVPVRLRAKLAGGDRIVASYILMDALAGGSAAGLSERGFDVLEGRKRCRKALQVLEKRVKQGKTRFRLPKLRL